MKRFSIFAICLAVILETTAADDQQINWMETAAAAPYRKIGDQIYNLIPLRDFLKKFMTLPPEQTEDFIAQTRLNGGRPLPGWEYLQGKTLKIEPDGILLSLEVYPGPHTEFVFLKRYPQQSAVADGDAIRFFGFRDGAHAAMDDKTAKAYDFGQIISKDEFASYVASLQKTNSVKR